MLDDDRRKAVTTVRYLAHSETLKHRPCRSHGVNVTMPTAALPGILATAGEFTKVAGIKVATKRNTGWHGDPPLPTLNQIKTDLGIPTESEIDAVGISSPFLTVLRALG